MKRLLTPDESKIYKEMIARAHAKPSNIWYTTADLLSQINHNLNGAQEKYLGTKFSYYAKWKSQKFEIKRSKGNNKYRTRHDEE